MRRDPIELFQKLTLPLVEVLRGLYCDLDIEVAHGRLAQDRHALALQAELFGILRAVGDLDPGLRAIERRHLEREGAR